MMSSSRLATFSVSHCPSRRRVMLRLCERSCGCSSRRKCSSCATLSSSSTTFSTFGGKGTERLSSPKTTSSSQLWRARRTCTTFARASHSLTMKIVIVGAVANSATLDSAILSPSSTMRLAQLLNTMTTRTSCCEDQMSHTDRSDRTKNGSKCSSAVKVYPMVLHT